MNAWPFLRRATVTLSLLLPNNLCRASPSIWRDECFFAVGGDLLQGRPVRVRSHVSPAGRYRKPCFMHLFAEHVGYLRSEHTLHEAMNAAEAIELEARTSKGLLTKPGACFLASPTMWSSTSNTAWIPDSRTQCISGAREALHRRLNQAVQDLKDGSQRGQRKLPATQPGDNPERQHGSTHSSSPPFSPSPDPLSNSIDPLPSLKGLDCESSP